VAYLFEFSYAIQLLRSPHDLGAIYLLTTIILVIDGIGLVRAWELLGARPRPSPPQYYW